MCMRERHSPAHSLWLKVARVAPVDDDYLVVLVQVALHSRLGRPGDVALEASPVARPPEGVALAVLFGEHQEDLRGDVWPGLDEAETSEFQRLRGK